MVKKSPTSPVPTPIFSTTEIDPETWDPKFLGFVYSTEPATQPLPAEPVQRPASSAPVQQTLAEPPANAPPVEAVKAPSDPTDIQRFPKDLGGLFAKRPLVLGESEADYDELLSRTTAAVKPTDTIEAVWIKDMVDLVWESQRLRRFKASLLMGAGRQALTNLLATTKDAGQANGVRVFSVPELISAYTTGEVAAVTEVDMILRRRGLDIDTLMAQALAEKLDDLERIDRLIAGADARRNRALNELERRRDSFARRLRLAAQDVADVR
ncbi:hypothetical protein ACD578_02600 [Microvirga sp. RSM25]|uniref:hypothetical protein n=1 Tax=Microvirga sp. RSM25 TaxID=3273802 RepID=UPI003850929E